VGNPQFGGNRRHQRLGTVATRHPDHIGTAPDRVDRQLAKVVPLAQDHGLDPSAPSLALEVEARGLPPT